MPSKQTSNRDRLLEYGRKAAGAGASYLYSKNKKMVKKRFREVLDSIPSIDDIGGYFNQGNRAQRRKVKDFQQSARNNNATTSKSKSLQNDYEVPGMSDNVMVVDKVHPKLKMVCGPTVAYDPLSTFVKNLKSKGHVSMSFKFKCASSIDKRGFHYQVFRHQLSPDDSQNDGNRATTGRTWAEMDAALPEGAGPLKILGPQSYLTTATAAGSVKGVIRTATTNTNNPIPDSLVYHSSLTLSDLEDLSYNITNQITQGVSQKFKPAVTDVAGSNYGGIYNGAVNFGISEKKYRKSFPGFWNSNRPGNEYINEVPKIYPCINNGKVKYTVSNKGIYPGKFEIVVFKVKKNKELPTDVNFYKNGVGQYNQISGLVAAPIIAAANEKIFSRFSNAQLQSINGSVPELNPPGAVLENSAGYAPSDPKYKFLPKVSQQKAENSYFKEVDRISTVLQAGDTRTLEVILGGAHYDPSSNTGVIKPAAGGFTYDNYPGIYTDNCYVLAINYHGLIHSEMIQQGDMVVDTNNPEFADYINGNVFAPCNFFVDAEYTEHVQTAEIRTLQSSNVFAYGQYLDDVKQTNVDTVATSIIPQSQTVSTTGGHHTKVTEKGEIIN